MNLLMEIKAKAEELGLSPNDVYDQFDDHLMRLEEMKEADDQYKKNEREFTDWS